MVLRIGQDRTTRGYNRFLELGVLVELVALTLGIAAEHLSYICIVQLLSLLDEISFCLISLEHLLI